jgi:LysR family glycine cleavage system transcriptional activator
MSGVLTVTASPAFAAKWLLPRIDRFQTACPDTDVRLDTNLKAVDFVSQRIDIGVRYGVGSWAGLIAEKLLDEEVYPVCSPEMLRKTRLINPSDLAQETLIHDLSMDGHPGFPTWSAWLQKAGVVNVSGWRGMKINNSAAVLQAALEGHGIALARSVMARDDLLSGRLVRLFSEISFDSPMAYYVVYRADCAGLPRIRTFRDWLMEEARALAKPTDAERHPQSQRAEHA